MIHWTWLIAAFILGGGCSLFCAAWYLTQGFNTLALHLWRETIRSAQRHRDEITARALAESGEQ